jgi:hypothetical protein
MKVTKEVLESTLYFADSERLRELEQQLKELEEENA